MLSQLIHKMDIHSIEIEQLIHNLNAAQLNYEPEEGKWSIRLQLAHLGRYHEVFTERLEKIRTEENPVLGRYKAEWDPEFKNWTQLSPLELKERTEKIRKELKKTLLSLSQNILKRRGSHPKFGSMSILDWLEFFILHESHHMYSMFRIVKEHLNTGGGIENKSLTLQ